MFKKLDEFGLNHDEKILKRVEDESKRITQIKKKEATQPANNSQATSSDAVEEYQIDQGKMQAIARSSMCIQEGKDAESDEFIERINKLVKGRKNEQPEHKQEHYSIVEEGKGDIILGNVGFFY